MQTAPSWYLNPEAVPAPRVRQYHPKPPGDAGGLSCHEGYLQSRVYHPVYAYDVIEFLTTAQVPLIPDFRIFRRIILSFSS